MLFIGVTINSFFIIFHISNSGMRFLKIEKKSSGWKGLILIVLNDLRVISTV